ncbi:MAG: nuclear transport factor 2 family protein [Turicibacter sp.]|nr:nuclear transport factor 2 family protein [Turicibacter sp.]
MRKRFRQDDLTNKRIEVLKEYFRKGDAGDLSVLDLFTDDVEFYYPKFGIHAGKAAILDFMRGLQGALQNIQHYPDEYGYYPSGRNIIAVEGHESGILKDGTKWPVKGRSDGLFSIIVHFKGDKISKFHVYADPDFAGRDIVRDYWRK